jgi:hypothetical protein
MTSAPSTTTFAGYYLALDDGKISNRTVGRFNEVLDTTKTNPSTFVDSWSDPNGVILVSLEGGKIGVVHGVKNVGGTFDTPGTKIVGHFGVSTRAIAGVVDHAVGSSVISCTLPTKAERANCMTIEDLRQLVTPAPGENAVDDNASIASTASKGRRAKKTSGTVPDDDDTSTTSKKKKSKKSDDPEHEEYRLYAAFKPEPRLQKAILESGATTPEELITHVRDSMDDVVYPSDSSGDEHRIHMDLFEAWSLGVMTKQIPSVRIVIDPFNDDIHEISNAYHIKCLGNKYVGTTMQGPNGQGLSDATNSALDLLAKSVFRMKEDNESTADVLSRQLTFQREVEEKKKDKTEDWHDTTKNMIKNCASEDGETPAPSIPKSYLDIINSKSAGLAIQSIQASMDQRGHREVGWPEVLAQSLQKGSLLYKSLDKPSGLTIHCLYVTQPLQASMGSRGVEYHYKKVEDFSKMSIRIPPNFDEMVIVVKGFHGIVSIVFGENSILAKQLTLGIEAIESNRSRLRANIATDVTLIAKILHKIDMHTQRWIEQCNDATDREFVDDGILCFEKIVNDAVMCDLNLSLPKVIQDLLIGDDDDDDGDRSRKRKNGKTGTNHNNNNNNNDVVVMNNDRIKELVLKANENYAELIRGKGVNDRVKWDDDTMMCVRYHINGRCVKHCRHSKSHVPANQVPNKKKTDMIDFLKKMRELTM